MPIIKSAKKRVKTAKKAAVRNSKTKRSFREAIKLFGKKTTSVNHSKAQSSIDKAAKKGVINKNKAARIKKQLATKAKASGVKPTAKRTSAKAAPAKAKATAKKPAVRKPAAKRPAAKKSATKK